MSVQICTVATFRTRPEAEHACAFLIRNEIHAVVWADDVGGLNPAVGFIETFEVRSRADQADHARELLSDFGISTGFDPAPDGR